MSGIRFSSGGIDRRATKENVAVVDFDLGDGLGTGPFFWACRPATDARAGEHRVGDLKDAAMTDTSSASAAREDLESVDSLTAEKLRLEIEELKWRRDLERKKLAGELDQLREAPARARKAVRLTGATALLSQRLLR